MILYENTLIQFKKLGALIREIHFSKREGLYLGEPSN